MNYKRITSFVLAFSMVCSGTYISENKSEVSNVITINAETREEDFIIDSNGVITKYKGADSIIRIPYSINNINVTAIGDYAFFDCAFIEEVVIPESVMSIGVSAFRNCSSLKEIYIPTAVQSIGSNVFNDCEKLTHITVSPDNQYYSDINGVLFNKDITQLIQYPEAKTDSHYNVPESVVSIADYSFYKCFNLQSVYIPENVQNIGIGAFWGCTGIQYIDFSNDSMLLNISDYAFYYCTSLSSIEIPVYISSIGRSAFAECISLTSIGIPSSMVNIVDTLFVDCINLNKIYIIGGEAPQQYGDKVVSESGNLTDSIIWSFDLSTKTITINGNGEIPEGTDISAMLKITDAEKIIISDGITSVPHGLFDTMENITVYAPENVYSTNNNNVVFTTGLCGENVFWKYDNINHTLVFSGSGDMYDYSESILPYSSLNKLVKHIIIENGINNITSYAFSDFESLTDIYIPETVSFISDKSFSSCSKLSEINTDENNQYYSSENGVLFNKDKTILIKYPEGKTETSYNIPETVSVIDSSAFENALNLNEVYLTENIEIIREYAFFNTNINNISVPDTVNEIKEYALGYCCSENLIPQKKENFIIYGQYNSSAYDYAVNNEILFVTKGMCGDNAEWKFDYTSATLTISGEGAMKDYMPSTVPYLSVSSLIENVVIEEGITNIGKCAFYKFETLKNIQFAESITDIGNSAFFCCTSLANANLCNNITRIGDSSFLGCISLSEIKIPENTVTIENSAFYNCTSLANVELSNSLLSIGEKAFYCCPSLSEIKIPENVNYIGEKAFGYVVEEIKSENFTVLGLTNSEAYNYCLNNQFNFISFNGKCGENSEWLYNDEDKTITIIGSGDVTEFNIDEKIKSVADTVIIDNNITYIPEDIFNDFAELNTVYISDNLYIDNDNINIVTTGMCGDNVFWKHDKNEQTLIIYGQGDMYDYSESIPPYADLSSSINHVIIKSGVTIISDYAFSDFTQLTDISISDTVSYIGSEVFESCTLLSEINTDENNQYYSSENGVLFNNDKTILIKYPEGKTETSYSIPETVSVIDNSAFENVLYLNEVYLTENVEIIGEYAFFNTNLNNISVPDTVKEIGEYSLGYCMGEIPYENFEICGGYNSASYNYAVNNNLKFTTKGNCGDNAQWQFDYETATLVINGQGALNNYSADLLPYPEIAPMIQNVTIEDGITEIGECMFYNCTNLKNIQLPDTLTRIGNSAFFCCTSLENINLPDNIDYIGDSSFLCCTALKEIKIPENTQTIEDSAFYGCTSLENVNLGDNLSFIGEKSFYYCTSLSEIKIPENVDTIEEKAFGYYDNDEMKTENFTVYGFADSEAQIYAENNDFIFNVSGAECGENTAWVYDYDTAVLTLAGTGNITESNLSDEIKNSAETLVIGKDVLDIEIILPELKNLKNIEADEENSVYSTDNGILFADNGTELVKYPSCKEDISYTVPESVAYINENAFTECISLQEIIVNKCENECTEMNLPENISIDYAESVDLNLTNISSSNEEEKIIESDTENYSTILTAKEGFRIADIEVKVGGNLLTADIDYTYNSETGELIINREVIEKDLVIIAVAEKTETDISEEVVSEEITPSDDLNETIEE